MTLRQRAFVARYCADLGRWALLAALIGWGAGMLTGASVVTLLAVTLVGGLIGFALQGR